MGHKKTIIEETEYGTTKTTIRKVVTPLLVPRDDYQELLTMAVDAVRNGINTGRKGNFGITFIVDDQKKIVKRAEPFFTESVTRVEIES